MNLTCRLLYKGQFWVCIILLIGRLSELVARPRLPRGALSARVVSTAPAPDGDGSRESVCTGKRGEGGVAEHWGGRWRLVCSLVQSSTGRPKLFDRNKIGYAYSNGGIDGPVQSRVGHSSWYINNILTLARARPIS